MAVARRRLQRAWLIETALLDNQTDHMMDDLAQAYESMDEAVRAALSFRKVTETSLSFPILLRYESRLSRQFDRSLARLTASARLPKMKSWKTNPIPKMNTRHHMRFNISLTNTGNRATGRGPRTWTLCRSP